MDQGDHSFIAGQSITLNNHFRNNLVISQKPGNSPTSRSSYSTPGHITKDAPMSKDTCSAIFKVALIAIARD